MYLPIGNNVSDPTTPQTELRHTAATISYAGQLLLGSTNSVVGHTAYTMDAHRQGSGGGGGGPLAELQSVYDLQMEQRWSVHDQSRFV